jgi:hypothetical protein
VVEMVVEVDEVEVEVAVDDEVDEAEVWIRG